MIVAVTGASGHIGANLVRALLREKDQIRALVHNSREGLKDLDIQLVRGNLDNLDSLCRAFGGAEVVYHLAAKISLSMHDWSEVEAINVLGTRNVVNACLQCGVRRLIYFSSIHALIQEPMNTPVDESRPLADYPDRPPYDRSKAASEREVLRGIEDGLDAIILNPTAVIGPHDYRLSHLGEVLLAMAQGKLPALVEGGFDWVDVRDVVNGAIQAQKKAPMGAKYLLPGHWARVYDLAKLTEDILGTPAPRFICPTWMARASAPLVTAFNQLTRHRQLYTGVSIRALSHCNQHISHDRATHEFSYQPRSLRETLTDTFHWFQERGMLDSSKNQIRSQ